MERAAASYRSVFFVRTLVPMSAESRIGQAGMGLFMGACAEHGASRDMA